MDWGLPVLEFLGGCFSVCDGFLGCVTVVCGWLRGRAASPPCQEVIFWMVFEIFSFFF